MSASDFDSHTSWMSSVLERFERPLLQYAMSITRDLERARDIVQETFLRLQRQNPEAIEGHLSQWLFTVCRNCALNTLKKEDRFVYVGRDDFEMRKCEAPTPSVALERKEKAGQLMAFVELLPKNQQDVVRLKFQNHHTYQEISDITNLSVSNVGFLLNAALRALRLMMERAERRENIIYLQRGAA